MGRLASLALVRIGLVFLVLTAWARLVPGPSRADVMADELAIAVSAALVAVGTAYLLLTRGGEPAARHPMPARRADGEEKR